MFPSNVQLVTVGLLAELYIPAPLPTIVRFVKVQFVTTGWLQSGPDLYAMEVDAHPGRLLRVKSPHVTDEALEPVPLRLRAPVPAHSSDLAPKPLAVEAPVLAALLRDRHPVVQRHAVDELSPAAGLERLLLPVHGILYNIFSFLKFRLNIYWDFILFLHSTSL